MPLIAVIPRMRPRKPWAAVISEIFKGELGNDRIPHSTVRVHGALRECTKFTEDAKITKQIIGWSHPLGKVEI